MLPAEPNSAPKEWGDGERFFSRSWRPVHSGDTVLIARPASERPRRAIFDRFAHQFSLKDELDSAWAVRPLELVHEAGHTLLVLDDLSH